MAAFSSIEGGPTGIDQDVLIAAGYRTQGQFDQMDFGISIDSPFLTCGVSYYRQILMEAGPWPERRTTTRSPCCSASPRRTSASDTAMTSPSRPGLEHHGWRPRVDLDLRLEDPQPSADPSAPGPIPLNSDL